MNLDYFDSFFVVVEEGSITKAANKLHISQPALSAQINCLEKYFQVSLVERSSKGVKLTPAGETLYEEGKRFTSLFKSMSNKIREHAGEGTKKLYIGASSTIGNHALPCSIFNFKKRYPQYDIKMKITNSEEVANLVMEDKVGMGIIEGPVDKELREEFKISGIQTKRLLYDRLNVLAPYGPPWAKRDFITIEELFNQDLILREKSSGIRKTIEQTLTNQGLDPSRLNMNMELNNSCAIINAVKTGKGLSILPKNAFKQDLVYEALSSLVVEGVEFYHPYTLLYHPSRLKDFLHREFFELLINEEYCFC
ncbi:LysR family transcriptional regulator [Natranaerobius thermophilus]|uniref:Transcriptional regulator, LysR family n=1 Tax=Natranaerobius thermophilus (strain ATCC BAA-1301 / DSM 18059 / JW/NM-WN-LF) TaxID=457570 RepID=B2A8N2_NATTJ|nr:LysR family transcriptional regulator [Natranaerobius thermophilus]ACB85915.1 transcriptional regulator, LysR family [Natranaerobius thermophilus JW/NM-WN-LF]